MDIKERLKRVQYFDVTPDLSSLRPKELDALEQCVAAARITTDLFMEQVGPGNPEIYRELSLRTDDEGRDMFRYFLFHGRPWDKFDKQPFVPGTGPYPEPYLGDYYPSDLTKAEWDRCLAEHPQDREALESYFTVIRRFGGNALGAVPYSIAYRPFLDRMRAHLRSAANELQGTLLGTFLTERQRALASNEYRSSDMVWVDTDGTPFEVTFGPYEQYMDGLNGIKAAFEAYIGLPDRQLTGEVQKFLPVLAEVNAELAERLGFTPSGGANRVIVTNDVFRAGEAAHQGFQFVAYCLPNDRWVHEHKGSKRVISRTMMNEKVARIAQPIAERTLSEADMSLYSPLRRLLYVTAHEMAHGAGPTMIVRADGTRIGFETALGSIHSPVEEAKADALGAVLLKRLADKGLISGDDLAGCYASEAVDYARQWRVGLHEAHGRGAMVQYNWLKGCGGVRYEDGQFRVDTDKFGAGMATLADKLIGLEQAGDPAKANAFMDHWSAVPAEVKGIDRRFDDLPVDVYPEFRLPF